MCLLIGVALSWSALCLEEARADNPHAGHVPATQAQIAPESLPTAHRMTGLGNAYIQISASSAAQAWFNQGLNLFHDFWDYEAERAFEQGIRSDPSCAMCYWGLYQAESNYHSASGGYASAALSMAQQLEPHVGEAERLYIEASVAEHSVAQSVHPDLSRAIALLRELSAKYPSDLQAKIFLANALPDGYSADGTANPGQRESLALLQQVMKEDPNNSAANHYWIHAMEGLHPEQAVASAQLVAILAPSSGHMVHMPGHIYYRLGEYALAEKSFQASMEVDERYMRDQHVSPDNDWNYVHNLMYAVANFLEEGKIQAAEQVSAKLAAARGELPGTAYAFSARDSIARINPQLPVALRIGDWSQAQEQLNRSPEPDQPNLQLLKRCLAAFVTGMQALEQGDTDTTGKAIRDLDAELWTASEDFKNAFSRQMAAPPPTSSGPPPLVINADALLQPLVSYLAIMSLELRGAALIHSGKTDQGKMLFSDADREEQQRGYREPPHFIQPVGEVEGAALMAVRDWTSAMSAYQQALAERPHSGFPMYGLARCREEAGDISGAVSAYREFIVAWQQSDSDRPERSHARAFLNAH